MTFWICGVVCLVGAATAAFSRNVKTAVLALWLTGMGTGGLFLSLGAEVLAVIQWLVSTLSALAFVFYAVMFGEYRAPVDTEPKTRMLVRMILPVLVGAGLVSVVVLGTNGLDHSAEKGAAMRSADGAKTEQDAASMGRTMAKTDLVSIEILALMLFFTVIGAGVIARPEEKDR